MSETVLLESPAGPGHRAGDLIAGKYRLERELGRGAMGTVWAALHTTLGQRVAIKLISGDQSNSADARTRFRLEAKAAARLRSRHVVAVYDDGETPDGTPYIVMEFLDGETLEQRLERQRDVSLSEAVRITTHVARALARAHAQNIVHRDLKSGNIFLAKTEDDEIGWVAKVLDFGVAKLTDAHGPSTTKTGMIVGTPLFMSPEQIRGASHVDHRADLYSLGMVFYNMVTGAHAFDGPSYSDVLVSICTQTLPDIRLTAPWLPPGVRSWFDKACAREREARFQSADEMIEALLEAVGPSARDSHPSIPDDMGPSGTLVGYGTPEANSTVVMNDSPVASVKMPPEQPPASSGTLRSRISSETETARPSAALTRGALALWAGAGVGIAIIAMLIATAIGRVSTRRSDAAAPEPAAAKPAREGAAHDPARTDEPVRAEPARTPDTPAVPPPPPPERAEPEPAPEPDLTPKTAPARTRSAAPSRPTPRSAANPAPPKPAAPSAPDMGF